MLDDKNKEGIGVEFQIQNKWKPARQEQKVPKMIQWVIKYSRGLIKTEQQATYVLLGFAVLAIIISLILFFSGGETLTIPEDIKVLPAEI